MEQSNGNDNDNVVVWSRDERQVAEILVEMRHVMLDLDADLRIPFQWGRKRKRSAIQDDSVVLPQRLSYSPKQKPLPAMLQNGGADGGGEGGDGDGVAAVKVTVKVKVEASSPATPLSLSLTESDEKPNDKPLRTKASLKRKRDYYLKTIEDLTERKAKLNQEIEKVSRYREQLKAFNLKLKERKQELSNGPKRESKNPNSQMGRQMQQLVHAPVNPSNSLAENQHQNHSNHHHDHQLQVLNTPQKIRLRLKNTSGPPQLCSSEGLAQSQHVSGQSNLLLPMQPSYSPSSPSAAPLTLVNNTGNAGTSTSGNKGSLGGVVLDLNVSPEELIQVESYQPLDATVANKDLSKVMAAQARQRRIQINRFKNTIGNNIKPRYSCRS